MFPEKAKRKRKARGSFTRSLLIGLIMIPLGLFLVHPQVGQSLLVDGISLSVAICAAVYIVHQGIIFLIASYLGIIDDSDESSFE